MFGLKLYLKKTLTENTTLYKTKIVLHTSTQKHDMHDKIYIFLIFLVQIRMSFDREDQFQILYLRKTKIIRTASSLLREKEKK